MLKKVFVLLIVFAMAASFAACGLGKPENGSEYNADIQGAAPLSGGWGIAENEACVLPEKVQTAFDKAAERFTGNALKPVAYVASQVVAGTNYMILCEAETVTAEPVTSYQIAIVYADLSGNGELTNVTDFEIAAYTDGNSTEVGAEQLTGGWSVPEDAAGAAIPEEAKTVFLKATEGFTGSSMEPLALLGTQVVAGTNYAFLCKTTLTTPEPVTGIQVVTVYADLEGNAEIINVAAFDPADFNK